MNILSRWLHPPVQRRRRGGAAALRAAALAELTEGCAAADAAADERPPGCGWFDSSHDLQRGLWVCEQPEIEQIVAGLPLEPWLALHLAGWRPRVPG